MIWRAYEALLTVPDLVGVRGYAGLGIGFLASALTVNDPEVGLSLTVLGGVFVACAVLLHRVREREQST